MTGPPKVVYSTEIARKRQPCTDRMKNKKMASRPSPAYGQLTRSKLLAVADTAVTFLRSATARLRPVAGRLHHGARHGFRRRPMLASVGVLLVATGLLLGLARPSPEPAGPAPSLVQPLAVQPIPVPVQSDEPQAPDGLVLEDSADLDAAMGLVDRNGAGSGGIGNVPGLAEADTLDENWQTVTVNSGETLERIFRRVDLGPGLLHQVVNLDDQTRGLARIRPGDEFNFLICPEEGFQAMRAELDDEHWLLVEANGESLVSKKLPRALTVEVVEATAEIRSSLFNAGSAAGLSDGMIMRLANVFGWDIDFALDIRAGDHFALVYERIYREGEFLRDGNIIAARFTNRGSSFEAIRFETADGADYYNAEGRPMRRAFLRAPLNFTRVTSDFNPRRFHPITRRTQPHNGIDYGAPTGTPVWASGDGRVIESGYGRANGNYVFIQHGNNIITRYLHLHTRAVNRGDRVRQGQTIGTVGATGMATGPHLHYEFLVNGAHRNPRTVDLPEAEPLPDEYLPLFQEHKQSLLARLDEADIYPLQVASGAE